MAPQPDAVGGTLIANPSSAYDRVYAVVRRIPRGRVATYGQVARLAGMHGHARQVGYALHALSDGSSLPWHRVVNAHGGISMRTDPFDGVAQRSRLEREGVAFNASGRLSLEQYQWKPSQSRAGMLTA